MGYIQAVLASLRSLRWRRKRCSPFVAVINEDSDWVVISALECLPFDRHSDMLAMSLPELLRVAKLLNSRLPSALHIDCHPLRTIEAVRHDIEAVFGYARSAPEAMKVPFSMDTISRRQSVGPKASTTPSSQILQRKNTKRSEESFAGKHTASDHSHRRTPTLQSQESSADQLRALFSPHGPAPRTRTSGNPKRATSPHPPITNTPWRYGKGSLRVNRTATKQTSTSLRTPKRSSSAYETFGFGGAPPANSPSRSVQTKGSTRGSIISVEDMDMLVLKMMGSTTSRNLVSPPISVEEFGVMR